MGWPWWALTFHYDQHGHERCHITERNRASEHLIGSETTVSENSTLSGSSVAYLDHDHCKSENISFLAVLPFRKDLWGTPSRGVGMT